MGGRSCGRWRHLRLRARHVGNVIYSPSNTELSVDIDHFDDVFVLLCHLVRPELGPIFILFRHFLGSIVCSVLNHKLKSKTFIILSFFSQKLRRPIESWCLASTTYLGVVVKKSLCTSYHRIFGSGLRNRISGRLRFESRISTHYNKNSSYFELVKSDSN